MTQVLTIDPARRPAAAIAAALIAALALTVLIASSASAQSPEARLRVLHASPDAPAVDVYLDGTEAISDLAFDDITDYVSVPAGDHNVQVFPASASGSGDPVIDADVTLTADTDYTVAAVGLLAGIEPLVLVDDNSDPASGEAKLRFVHASPDAPAVDIYADGAGVVVPNASFKDASDYLALPAGSYDIEVRAAGTETVALDLPGVTLEAGNTYTAFAVGLLEGDPDLAAKLTVDATAQEATPTPAPSAPTPADVPTSGGPLADEGSNTALWLAIAGALLVALTVSVGAARLIAGRKRSR